MYGLGLPLPCEPLPCEPLPCEPPPYDTLASGAVD